MPGTLKVSQANIGVLSNEQLNNLIALVDTIQTNVQTLQSSVESFNNTVTLELY